jgi:hypothetical protein
MGYNEQLPVYTPDEFILIALTAPEDIPMIHQGMPKNCGAATIPVYSPDGPILFIGYE